MPLTPTELFAKLDSREIQYEVMHHPPLRTVDDALALRPSGSSDDGEIKNLFLRNKKGKMWLFTIFHTSRLDLKGIAEAVGGKRFSFCSEERLMQYMGVKPGAVSPFCLLNDINQDVEFYVDETLMTHEFWYPHPLDNTMTLKLPRTDLLGLLKEHGHGYQVINLEQPTIVAQ